MTVKVNGIELTDDEISAELPFHQDADRPLDLALSTLVVRRLIRDEAARLGVEGDDETVIDALLEREVSLPQIDEETCKRHYAQHPASFMVGECIEADHILFQITHGVDLDALRMRAQEVLEQVLAEPDRFAEMACVFSNCPSSVVGGNLGQLSRGETVPEFERVVFSIPPGTVLPRLLETRHGLHIVRVGRHEPGRLLPYDMVSDSIREALTEANRNIAWKHYLQTLSGKARIEGLADFMPVEDPLLQ